MLVLGGLLDLSFGGSYMEAKIDRSLCNRRQGFGRWRQVAA